MLPSHHMGVSENSVPLNPMVLLIIIPFLNGYFIGNINPTFSDKPILVAHFLGFLTDYHDYHPQPGRKKVPRNQPRKTMMEISHIISQIP